MTRTVTFINPWGVEAYGQIFIGSTPEQAMDAADAFGERNRLRAVSLVARRIVPAEGTVPAPGRGWATTLPHVPPPAPIRTIALPLAPLDEWPSASPADQQALLERLLGNS